MSDAGDLHVATVVVNVVDMERGVKFWCAALGYEPRERGFDREFMMLQDPSGRGVPVSLQLADRPAEGPTPVHLDLYTDHQAEHVARLLELGAEQVDDWPYPPDPDFVVLRDSDGNEFCIIDHHDLA